MKKEKEKHSGVTTNCSKVLRDQDRVLSSLSVGIEYYFYVREEGVFWSIDVV